MYLILVGFSSNVNFVSFNREGIGVEMPGQYSLFYLVY